MNVSQSSVERAQSAVRDVPLLWIAIASVVGDRVVTLLWWSHEANPLVAELGMGLWVLVTVVLVAGLIGIRVAIPSTFETRAAQACLVVVIALHSLTVVTNLLVVAGYL